MNGIDPKVWTEFRRRQDDTTFEPLYRATKAVAYTICYRILRNPEDARDAFQAAYARVVALARAGEPAGSPEAVSGLVYQAAIREADSLRKRRGRRERREWVMEQPPEAGDPQPLADQLAADRQLRAQLETLVNTLPDHYRLPILMHYFHGMATTEVAHALGRPVSTISHQISRGLKKLRPLARRAGLGDALAGLGAVGATGLLLEPPAALAAPLVLAEAKALLAAGGTLAGGSLAGTTAAKTTMGVTLMKAKTAVVATLIALAAVGTVAVTLMVRDDSSTKTKTATASQTRGAADSTSGDVALKSAEADAGSTGGDAVAASTDEPSAGAAGASGIAAPPEQILAVQVVWEASREPATGTTVTLRRAAAEGDSAPIQATVDEKGRASLGFPAASTSLHLEADHPDASLVKREITLPAEQPLLIALRPATSIHGRVLMADGGRPAAGATVRLLGSSLNATADPQGAFRISRIEADEARLAATLGVQRSFLKESEIETHKLFAGKLNGPYDLFLRPGLELRGTVRDKSTQAPLAGAAITAEFGLANAEGAQETQTAADGGYQLAGLAEGKYAVRAAASGHTARTDAVDVAAGGSELDFELDAAGLIKLRVLDPERKPIEGATVFVRGGFGERSHGIENHSTDADGRLEIPGVPLTSWSVYSFKDGFETAESPFVLNEAHPETEVEVLMQRLARGVIVGRVSDTADAAIADASVDWLSLNGAGNETKTTTDQDGRYRLETQYGRSSLSQLTASHKGYAPAWQRSVIPGSEQSPTEVNFTLEPGHWLEVRVVDSKKLPIPGAEVSAHEAGRIPVPLPGNSEPRKTDAAGQARLEDLPGPKVGLKVGGTGWSDISHIEFEVDQAVEVVLRGLGTLRGLVLDEATDKPLPEFTVTLEPERIPWENPDPKQQRFTPADGRFSLDQINMERRYELNVAAEGYEQFVEKPFQPAEGAQGEERVFKLKREDRQLRGVVLDAQSRQPIAGAQVATAIYTDNPLFEWDNLTESNASLSDFHGDRTAPDGSFVLSAGGMSHSFFARAEGYEPLRLDPESLPRETDAPLTIDLNAAASVAGAFRVDGRPLTGQTLLLIRTPQKLERGLMTWMLNDPGGAMRTLQFIGPQVTDAEGAYQFKELKSGFYHLGHHVQAGGSGTFRLSRRFSLEPGEQLEINMGEGLGPFALSGRVLSGGASVPPGVNFFVSLDPLFDWDYGDFTSQADAQGNYRIEGLRPGAYQAQVLRFSMNELGASIALTETIQIAGHLAHDFNVAEGHRVTLRLRFPAVITAPQNLFPSVELQAVEVAPEDAPTVATFGQVALTGSEAAFLGRFKGNYRLRLVDKQGGGRVDVPGVLAVNNLEGDQNLGEIAIQLFGKLRLRLTFEPPLTAGDATALALLTEEGAGAPPAEHEFLLDARKPLQTIEQIPVGRYRVEVGAVGYEPVGPAPSVTILPEETTDLALLLRRSQP